MEQGASSTDTFNLLSLFSVVCVVPVFAFFCTCGCTYVYACVCVHAYMCVLCVHMHIPFVEA